MITYELFHICIMMGLAVMCVPFFCPYPKHRVRVCVPQIQFGMVIAVLLYGC